MTLTMLRRSLFAAPVLVVLSALASVGAAASLAFDTPPGWVSKAPSSSSRVAEFTLPRADGDAEDADVTVFFFPGMSSNVQANLDRWIGQFAQPDGSATKDRAKTSTLEAHGLAITLLDVTGTFVAEVSPGSADHFNKPGFRMLAAVVETPGGPYFVKLTGPGRTVAKWLDSFQAFLKSLRVG